MEQRKITFFIPYFRIGIVDLHKNGKIIGSFMNRNFFQIIRGNGCSTDHFLEEIKLHLSCIQIAELKIIIHITVSGIFLIDLVTYFLEYLHKLPVIQWLQEVSADLKRDGFFGIVKIFVSCGKDESGMTVCSKSCDHIQTAHNRHGYIHKGNIGFDIFNKLDSGLSVISFPCNVINVLFFKKIDQRFSEKNFIVNNYECFQFIFPPRSDFFVRYYYGYSGSLFR